MTAGFIPKPSVGNPSVGKPSMDKASVGNQSVGKPSVGKPTPGHHVSDEMLMSYAAGNLAAGWSLAVATHLACCAHCRARARIAAAVGGMLLEEIDTVPLREGALQTAMARIAQTLPEPSVQERPPAAPTSLHRPERREGKGLGHTVDLRGSEDTGQAAHRSAAVCEVPAPLRRYIGDSLDALPWKNIGGGARQIIIPTGESVTTVRLLRIGPGATVPEHGHRGLELTVVLRGSLVDADRRFLPGDVEEADEDVEHQPRAGDEGECICLAVTDAPLRFKSLLLRLVQPLLRI